MREPNDDCCTVLNGTCCEDPTPVCPEHECVKELDDEDFCEMCFHTECLNCETYCSCEV